MKPEEIRALLPYLSESERAEIDAIVAADIEQVIWRPLDGPQRMAYESTADVIGFGGSAGGGKTDLAVGKGLTQHFHVMVMRRESTQLEGIYQRLEELLGGRDGFNGQAKIWRNAGPRGVQIEFGSVPNLGDERKHQGRPHDFLVFDEATNFLEQQVMFLMGWNRSARHGVKSQTLMTFNPPTSAEGRWVVEFFAPWLDGKHALYPTAPGVVRYAITVPNENGTSRHIWVEDGRSCVLIDGVPVYEFDPAKYQPEDIVVPQSRTFIPSRISDNPYLASSGYMRVLQAMPEPLRSQMLYGDFQAGMTDDPWQVVPTAWIDAAMARWQDRSPKGEMMAMGVDVARGGKDNTIIGKRHRTENNPWWFDRLAVHPGAQTPSGNQVAGQVIAERRDNAPIMIDVIGVGASPYDLLKNARQDVYGINVSEKARRTDRSGRLTFFNYRSELWWSIRELLDPENDSGAALPPDKELAKELAAPRWEMTGTTIRVEGREQIVARTGRSPDRATAIILAAIEMPKVAHLESGRALDAPCLDYDPYRSTL